MTNKTKKKKNSKKAIHDYLFQDVYSQKEYSLDLFRLVFTAQEFCLFNWKTLKTELTTFIDSEWKQKRMDVAFSVQVKSNKQKAKIILLLEHKSFQKPDVLKQLLDYQSRIYFRHDGPVIPIIIYHGEKKKWDVPLSFHDSLKGLTPTLKKYFGEKYFKFSL